MYVSSFSNTCTIFLLAHNNICDVFTDSWLWYEISDVVAQPKTLLTAGRFRLTNGTGFDMTHFHKSELYSSYTENQIIDSACAWLTSDYFALWEMGLLTILKKMKEKEKEMRLLMLYPCQVCGLLVVAADTNPKTVNSLGADAKKKCWELRM